VPPLEEEDVLTNVLGEGDGKDATNKYFIDVLLLSERSLLEA